MTKEIPKANQRGGEAMFSSAETTQFIPFLLHSTSTVLMLFTLLHFSQAAVFREFADAYK